MLPVYTSAALVIAFGVIAFLSYLQFQYLRKQLPEIERFDDLQGKLGQKDAELASLQEQVDEARGLIIDADQARAILARKDEVLELEGQLVKLESVKAEYDLYFDKLEKVTQELNEKQKLLAPLEGKHDELIQAIEDLAEKNQKLVDANRALDIKSAGLEKERDGLIHEISSLSATHDKLLQEISNQKNEISRLQDRVAELRSIIAGSEAQVRKLEQQEEQLDEKVKELKEEIQKKEIRLDAIAQEEASERKRLEGLQYACEEFQEKLDDLKLKLEPLEKDYQEKKALLAEFQSAKDSLENQIKHKEDELASIKERIEQARKELGKGGDDKASTLKDLWEPIKYPALKISKKDVKEEEALSYTHRYIRGKKLVFPDRTLHAFHTAMKCNDISPMAVLAGISGTGKSELPKCYSEGMGMHFTMLSVQPRWDSPQDLLGFYNYMEYRYKATELARALVRFDQYNREYWGEIPENCDDRSDRMLMVLFDEMNLARVEYYFSDFLSKLETRRGVDPNDLESRRKAEIELEIGSAHGSMHLFPGRNVLFAGTMNEDESTQTLSDKVLDRANVLRFGMPHNVTRSIGDKEVRSQEDALMYEDWQSWCEGFETAMKGIDPKSKEWIEDLKRAMNGLGRPYAHRVSKAIASYVRNYPKWVPEAREKALQDQLEMRILPKLRGIDIEDNRRSLDEIAKLIDQVETDDRLLSKAFREGMKDNNHGIFLWPGLDRSEQG